MKRKSVRAATRVWVAALFLILGCVLPSALPYGELAIPAEVEQLLEETLAGETAPGRLRLVRSACGLVGQVRYFWGGKSHALGWDGRWGWPQRVTSLGSADTGHVRIFGLDCSGFVSWAAATAENDSEAYERTGEGVKAQYGLCQKTEAPRSGDLAFFPDLSHVGIVLGRDREGTLWVVHCSASLGGVVVTPASVGFAIYGVPAILEDADVP